MSNEARLRFFLARNNIAAKLVWVLDDALYKRQSPSQGYQDITVFLPKLPHPATWTDTRPITLSDTIDRAMAQLLLHRCNHILLQRPPTHQYARAGKKGKGTAHHSQNNDWGFPLWILKKTSGKHLTQDWKNIARTCGAPPSARPPRTTP